MPRLREVELAEILPELPNLLPLERPQDLPGDKADLYLCALGFEDRCLAIVEWIAERKVMSCALGIYLEYETNTEDNAVNLPALQTALRSFCRYTIPLPCDKEDFTQRLRQQLQTACEAAEKPWVLLDISAFSAKSILLVVKVLLEFDIRLTVLYAEAARYFPTEEEFKNHPEEMVKDAGLSSGVRKIIPSSEHPGNRMDPLPDLVVVYPTFKPERTRAVLAEIDESLLTEGGKGIIWIVGRPRRHEDAWRAEATRKINGIGDGSKVYDASTFDYKESMVVLDRICTEYGEKYHITLMPLGSKMQSLAVALYWEVHQTISIIFAVPMSYNAKRYTEKCSSRWLLDFGSVPDLCALLDSVGRLEVL